MRFIRYLCRGGITIALVVVAAASAAQAGQCVADASATYRGCKADCREDFQAAKDTCLNRDHACVEQCRSDRALCVDETGFQDEITRCNATLAAARHACRQNNTDPDHCIDQAQVVAFQCRDAAREAAKPALKQCRRDFQACAQACPPADPPSTADPKQCKIDAKKVYLDCKGDAPGGCVEAFQVAKDQCRNRDHQCVEGCRDDRDTCLAPKLSALVAAIDACNATRDDDVQNCKDTFAEGTPERDQCIDNAQVAAFQCRDQARENAAPGIQGCRDAFQTCAQGCPPAS